MNDWPGPSSRDASGAGGAWSGSISARSATRLTAMQISSTNTAAAGSRFPAGRAMKQVCGFLPEQGSLMDSWWAQPNASEQDHERGNTTAEGPEFRHGASGGRPEVPRMGGSQPHY